MPPRPKKAASSPDEPTPVTLPNALKRAGKKGFTRDTTPKAPTLAQISDDAMAEFEELRTAYAAADLATGRGLTYEWEFFYASLVGRVQAIENGGGGGGGGGGGLSYVHTQSAAASTWTITHLLGTKPGVTVVASDGHQLIAEVTYPDDNTTVIVHGAPYAGTAYLRG